MPPGAARSTQHAPARTCALLLACIVLLGHLPPAAADIEDYCDSAAAAGLDYAVNQGTGLITSSCDNPGAELFIFCGMRGNAARCATVPACSSPTLGQPTKRFGCARTTDYTCCMENLNKPCASCTPVTGSCTEVCWDAVSGSGTPDTDPAPLVTSDPPPALPPPDDPLPDLPPPDDPLPDLPPPDDPLPPPSDPPPATFADPPPPAESSTPASPSDDDDSDRIVVVGGASPAEPEEQPEGESAPPPPVTDSTAPDDVERVRSGSPLADAVASSAPMPIWALRGRGGCAALLAASAVLVGLL